MGKTEDLINYSRVLELGEDNHQFLTEITDSYINSLKIFKEDYREALEKKDTEKFRDITHKIKGSMKFLEADSLVNEINHCRSKVYSGQIDQAEADSSIKIVTSICDRILQILYQYQQQFNSP